MLLRDIRLQQQRLRPGGVLPVPPMQGGSFDPKRGWVFPSVLLAGGSKSALLALADLHDSDGIGIVIRNEFGVWKFQAPGGNPLGRGAETLSWAVDAPDRVRHFVRTGSDGVTLWNEVWELPTTALQITPDADDATLVDQHSQVIQVGPFSLTNQPVPPSGWTALPPAQGTVIYLSVGARYDPISGETVWLLQKSLTGQWDWGIGTVPYTGSDASVTGVSIGRLTIIAEGIAGLRVITNGAVGYDDDVANATIDTFVSGAAPYASVGGVIGGFLPSTTLSFGLHADISPTCRTIVGPCSATVISGTYSTATGGGTWSVPAIGIPFLTTGPQYLGAVPRAGGDFACLLQDARSSPLPILLARSAGLVGTLAPTLATIAVPQQMELREVAGRLWAARLSA